MRLHPDHRLLKRHADSELEGLPEQRTAAHLASCARCRQVVEDLRALRVAATSLGAPLAPQGLVARVTAARARGLRAAIPGTEPAAPAMVRRAVLIGAAAVLIVGLVGIERWSPVDEPIGDKLTRGECGMNADPWRFATATSLFLAAACAQELADVPVEPPPPAAALEGRALREGTWVYELGLEGARTSSTWVYTLARVNSGHRVAWLSVAKSQTTSPRQREFADSMYFAADGVRPVRRVIRRAVDGRDLGVVTETFGPDSVRRVAEYISETRTVSVPIPVDVPVSPQNHGPGFGFMHVVRLLPLAEGWAGSVHFPTSVLGPAELEIVGDETIRVPAGTFECWRVTVQHGARFSQTLWVSKAERLLVKSRLGPGGPPLQWVLTSFTLETE